MQLSVDISMLIGNIAIYRRIPAIVIAPRIEDIDIVTANIYSSRVV